MKIFHLLATAAISAGAVVTPAAANTEYTNFVRQKQLPTGISWDMPVSSKGSSLSPLAIDLGGSRFELWTVKSASPPVSYLLDTAFVGSFSPKGTVEIVTEDTLAPSPRTRADRPFEVRFTVADLLSDPTAPEGAKALKLLRHVQSYGTKGTGANLDRGQATLLSQTLVNTNGERTLSYAITSIPGANRAKVRGEERFSLYTVDTNEQVASKTVVVWPVADGSITGLNDGEVLRFKAPQLTITVNDIYPGGSFYTQVYKGQPKLGTNGKIVPGGGMNPNQTVPFDREFPLSNYDNVFDSDGVWTMELLTITPFGIDRLDHVTFTIDRTIEIRGTVSTMD